MPRKQTCEGCPCAPADKDERRRLREKLRGLGLSDRQVDEPLAAELRQRGYRPRVAWRLARDFSQQTVADEFNTLSDSGGMRASRISEFERWPFAPDGSVRPDKGARPSLDALRTLATVYGTTWDQLVDLADLEHLSEEIQTEFRTSMSQRTNDRSVVSEGELPPEVPHFTGRHPARTELRERVRAHVYHGGPAVHVLDGPPGVGKTALARYAVTEFAKQYPEGAIWVDLFGFTPKREPRTSADLLERLLLEIDVPRETIEADPDRRAAQWRGAMNTRRMLLIFDNAAETAQVRELLPNSPGSFVLITSRSRLLGLVGARPMHLDVMDPDEAEELLAKFANLRLGHYDRTAARRIVAASGRLPLALKLFGSQLAHHDPGMLAESATDLTALTEELRGSLDESVNRELAETILDQFAAGDESVRTTFEKWYQRLRDPELQRTVRLLGAFPGPEISAEPLAAMADMPLVRAKTLIRKLFEAGLLDPLDGSHYRMHDMTKLYASMLAKPDDGLPAASERLVTFGLTIARRASVPGPVETPARTPRPADGAQARAWLSRERELLVGCVENTGASGQTAELARLVASHLCGRGRWSAAYRLYERSAGIASALGDQEAEAWALAGLGRVDRLSGRHEAAGDRFAAALALARSLQDRRCVAEVLCERGKLAWITGEHDAARDDFTIALDISRAIGHQPTECDALDGLSMAHRMVSDYAQARACSDAMLGVAKSLDDPERVGTGQWSLAECLRLGGDHGPARDHYVNALRIARGINYRKLEGDALRGLGHSERMNGRLDAAQRYFEEALAIARRIHDRYGEGWALWGLGNVSRAVGDSTAARAALEQSSRLAAEGNDPLGQMDALRGLGHLERHAGRYIPAQHYYQESLGIARQVGNPQGEADALRNIARVEALQGHVAQACERLRTAVAICARLRLPLLAGIEEEIGRLGC
ncbi:tetratricopeptide repeat protein [Nocardia sp. 2]|uniref:Tetratricopeptide repeat protein n=1 Tax=Nocardia acididurans TaxID=2802282 RepID=A0ABS1M564_9NOCA|nr:tetratricopeptide repeat protein [Nocardia acididurans]MBL1075792.1 tetratricopeptide repeat protein [Nocardia acididurans]